VTDNVVGEPAGAGPDVEVQKRSDRPAADALKESSRSLTLLSTLFEAAPVAFAFVDQEFRIVRLNEEYAAFSGARFEQMIGRTLAEVIPDLWPRVQGIYRRVLDTGEAVKNLPWIRPVADSNSDLHEWLASYYPVRVRSDVIGVGVVGVDITERVRAERFRSVVMSEVADGVFTQDGAGLLTYMNQAASNMLGWSASQLRGRRMHDVIHFQKLDGTPVRADECPLLTQATHGRVVRTIGEAFTRRDGSIFPVAYSAVPLHIGSRSEGIAVVFRNIDRAETHSNMIRVPYHAETAISLADFRGVLTKLQTTSMVSRRDVQLTPREVEVLTCLMEGLSNRLVAERLGVSSNTVRNHVQRILWKLNVHSKLEAVVVANRDGLAGGGHPRGPLE
jgi:PAS domain S-box-containing protein